MPTTTKFLGGRQKSSSSLLTFKIRFIENECTDEELYWLSEVFEDIVDRTRSVEFVHCLQTRVQHVENPEWKQSILDEILITLDYVEESQ